MSSTNVSIAFWEGLTGSSTIQFYFFLEKCDSSQLDPHVNAECMFLYGPIHFPWQ